MKAMTINVLLIIVLMVIVIVLGVVIASQIFTESKTKMGRFSKYSDNELLTMFGQEMDLSLVNEPSGGDYNYNIDISTAKFDFALEEDYPELEFVVVADFKDRLALHHTSDPIEEAEYTIQYSPEFVSADLHFELTSNIKPNAKELIHLTFWEKSACLESFFENEDDEIQPYKNKDLSDLINICGGFYLGYYDVTQWRGRVLRVKIDPMDDPSQTYTFSLSDSLNWQVLDDNLIPNTATAFGYVPAPMVGSNICIDDNDWGEANAKYCMVFAVNDEYWDTNPIPSCYQWCMGFDNNAVWAIRSGGRILKEGSMCSGILSECGADSDYVEGWGCQSPLTGGSNHKSVFGIAETPPIPDFEVLYGVPAITVSSSTITCCHSACNSPFVCRDPSRAGPEPGGEAIGGAEYNPDTPSDSHCTSSSCDLLAQNDAGDYYWQPKYELICDNDGYWEVCDEKGKVITINGVNYGCDDNNKWKVCSIIDTACGLSQQCCSGLVCDPFTNKCREEKPSVKACTQLWFKNCDTTCREISLGCTGTQYFNLFTPPGDCPCIDVGYYATPTANCFSDPNPGAGICLYCNCA